jgi:hypothetical protein
MTRSEILDAVARRLHGSYPVYAELHRDARELFQLAAGTTPEAWLNSKSGLAQAPRRAGWEYLVHPARPDHFEFAQLTGFNTLGADGWELVAVVPDHASVLGFFKRRVDDDRGAGI